MSRRARMIVFLAGAAGLAVMLGAAFARMPAFGAAVHLYRTLAVRDAVAHRTANVVSSVNFDLRGLDTLGEETILIASVVGAAVLLRPAEEETRRQPRYTGRTLESTRLLGYLLLPVTLIIGFDLVAHGHLTPGGGFQGGVVIATGIFLLYVTDSYQALGLLARSPPTRPVRPSARPVRAAWAWPGWRPAAHSWPTSSARGGRSASCSQPGRCRSWARSSGWRWAAAWSC